MRLGIAVVACLEVMVFANRELPITVARYEHNTAANDSEVRQTINDVFEQHEQRNRETNFANNQRTSNGLYSTHIVNQKTFDDEGYVSIRLAKVDSYLQTMNHSIIESNPEIYMTNDVVTEAEIPYGTWVQQADVSAEQIHVEKREGEAGEDFSLKPKETEKIQSQTVVEDETLTMTGNFNVRTDQGRMIKAYLKDTENGVKTIHAVFLDSDGTEVSYTGAFQVISEGEESYVQLYFPNTKKSYQSVALTLEEGHFVNGYVCRTERMTNTEEVLQKEFGFNHIEVETNASAGGYLVLLQADYPGWHAYVDGEEVEIAAVNECFMGVYLNAGSHTVEFHFVPIDFFIGLATTSIFLVCFLLVVLIKKVKMIKNVR